MSNRLTPLGWAGLACCVLTLVCGLLFWRLDALTADRDSWRATAAARDTLVVDAQGRAHRAAAEVAKVREVLGIIERVNAEQAETIRRLKAKPATVTTVTVQAPAETLVVATSDTVWASPGIREYRFDFAGASVGVTVDTASASASIRYKPVRLTVTTSMLRDKSWRTDVAIDPPVWEIAGLESYVLQEKPGWLERTWARVRWPLLLGTAACGGLWFGLQIGR